jgi:hypothetical protein
MVERYLDRLCYALSEDLRTSLELFANFSEWRHG